MFYAYHVEGPKLLRQDTPEGAIWLDLYRPIEDQVLAANALGFEIPTLAEMEEIEISNRLYRKDGVEVFTIPLPGNDVNGRRVVAPVTLMVSSERMATVRYHTPHSFEAFAERAGQTSAGCESHENLFLGLIEEIIARLADLMEEIGKDLERQAHNLFGAESPQDKALDVMLRDLGRKGEEVSGFRHSLVCLDRAMTMFSLFREGSASALNKHTAARIKDIHALVEHADFLSGRLAHITDVVLGLVNLEQSSASRLFSVVAVLFMPPTLVASVYGMNFEWLPGIHTEYGFEIAAMAMVASTLVSYFLFRWKGWI